MDRDKLTKFSLSLYGDITAYNEVMSKARCRIFYKYGNRNGTYITDEFAEKLISTLPYAPIKGIYDSMADDFTDHGKQRYEGRIYGIVPFEPNFAWESHLDEDGVQRTYACVDVLLYTAIYKEEAMNIMNSAQSMELYADSIKGDWKYIEGKRYFVFTDGCFLGLQALGQDYEPCFEGAAFYSLYDSIQELISRIERFELQSNQTGGEKSMNFKLSDDQKYNMIWTLLNPRFNEENGYAMDYAVCDVYDEYAIVFSFEKNGYERAYYTKDDSNDSLEINKMETCYIVDINEEEKKALEVVHAINGNTYEKIDENFESITNENTALKEEKETFSQKIGEFEEQITTLNQEKADMQIELDEAKKNYTDSVEENNSLKSQVEELTSFKADILMKEKEAIIEQYVNVLDAEVINSFKEKMNDLTKEELDKELAYSLVHSQPELFTKKKEDTGYVPKDDPAPSGIEGILSRYKK